MGPVALGLAQRAPDHLALGCAPRLAQRQIPGRDFQVGGLEVDDVRGQLAERELVAAREDHRALDHVLELAHVAGPAIARRGVAALRR